MATTDKKPIRSDSSMKKAIIYITNNTKTQNGELITCFDCTRYFAGDQMEFTRSKSKYKIAEDKPEIFGWSMYQSFHPDDNVTPELAHEIGMKTMEEYLGGKHQFVIATHVDKNHIHNHIVFNAVSHKDFLRHRSKKNDSIEELQNISDELCKQYGLSVIDNSKENEIENRRKKTAISHKEYEERKKGTSWKAKLQDSIDRNIKRSNSYEDFLKHMEESGYSIKHGKYIKFKLETENQMHHTSSRTIGKEYTEERIKERIAEKEIERNKEKETNKKPQWSKLLKDEIDKNIEKSDSYEDFLKHMEESGYSIKQGKHISFKNLDGQERFTRAKSLGYQYTEEMIKERIENKNIESPNEKLNKGSYKYQKDLNYQINSSIRYAENLDDILQALILKGYLVEKTKEGYNIFKNDIKVQLNIDLITDRIRYLNENKTNLNIGKIINVSEVEEKYKTWATIRNTQEVLKTTQFLLNNGYSIDSFNDEYNATINEAVNIDTQIKNVNEKINDFKNALNYLDTINENKEIYKEYLNLKKDSEFYKDNQNAIDAYVSADKKLKDIEVDLNTSKSEIYKKIDELYTKKTLLYDKKHVNKEKVENIKIINNNLNQLLDK